MSEPSQLESLGDMHCGSEERKTMSTDTDTDTDSHNHIFGTPGGVNSLDFPPNYKAQKPTWRQWQTCCEEMTSIKTELHMNKLIKTIQNMNIQFFILLCSAKK